MSKIVPDNCRLAWRKNFLSFPTKTSFQCGLVGLVFLTLVNQASASEDPFMELPAVQALIAESDGISGYYDRDYRPVEAQWWKKIPGWMQQDAQRRSVHRILDIGCGYGTLLSLSTHIYKALGFCWDITDYLKPAVANRYAITFRQGNAELDPVPWSEPFDVVILTEVIEHFNFHPLPTLKKIHDALAPGGLLFLSTPDADEWGRLYDFYRRLEEIPMPPNHRVATKDAHVWMYDKGELTGVLKDAGFRIIKIEYSPGIRGRHFNIWAKRPY